MGEVAFRCWTCGGEWNAPRGALIVKRAKHGRCARCGSRDLDYSALDDGLFAKPFSDLPATVPRCMLCDHGAPSGDAGNCRCDRCGVALEKDGRVRRTTVASLATIDDARVFARSLPPFLVGPLVGEAIVARAERGEISFGDAARIADCVIALCEPNAILDSAPIDLPLGLDDAQELADHVLFAAGVQLQLAALEPTRTRLVMPDEVAARIAPAIGARRVAMLTHQARVAVIGERGRAAALASPAALKRELWRLGLAVDDLRRLITPMPACIEMPL